jgi:hypothetical protein
VYSLREQKEENYFHCKFLSTYIILYCNTLSKTPKLICPFKNHEFERKEHFEQGWKYIGLVY